MNIDVYFQDETLWLTQKRIAELFEKGRSTITEHLKRILEDGELDEKVVCRNFRHTTQHGAIADKTQEVEVKYYNLKAITAVGYRVNSHRAIEFRKWATNILHEYIIKGFAMDDERLKHWPSTTWFLNLLKDSGHGKIEMRSLSGAEMTDLN